MARIIRRQFMTKGKMVTCLSLCHATHPKATVTQLGPLKHIGRCSQTSSCLSKEKWTRSIQPQVRLEESWPSDSGYIHLLMSIRCRGRVVGGRSWDWWNPRRSGRRAPPVSTSPLTTEETEAQKGWLAGRSHIYHFAKLGLESGVLTSTPIHSFLKCSNQTLNFCCSVAKSCLTIRDPHGLQYTRLHSPSLFPRVCSDLCPLSDAI